MLISQLKSWTRLCDIHILKQTSPGKSSLLFLAFEERTSVPSPCVVAGQGRAGQGRLRGQAGFADISPTLNPALLPARAEHEQSTHAEQANVEVAVIRWEI